MRLTCCLLGVRAHDALTGQLTTILDSLLLEPEDLRFLLLGAADHGFKGAIAPSVYRTIFGKSCAGFSNVTRFGSIFVSVKSVAGCRPFGIAV